MKIHELRQLAAPELQTRLNDEEENLANLRFQKATSQLESPIKIRTTRRLIAKLKTVLREHDMKTAAAAVTTKKQAPPAAQTTK